MSTLRHFVARHVETVEELETLTALHAGITDLAALPAATRLSPTALDEALGRLVARGVVALDPDGARAGIVLDDPHLPELLRLYQDDPVTVLKLLNSLAIERLRSGATRAFADAFLLRKRDPDG